MSSQPATLQGGQPDAVVVHGSAKGFAQEISVGVHRLLADEPAAVGGTDTGPGPYDLLIAALGTCTSMTVSLYARRKQWPLEGVTHPRTTAATEAQIPRRRTWGKYQALRVVPSMRRG